MSENSGTRTWLVALPIVAAVIAASYLVVDAFGWEGRPAREFVGMVILLVVFAGVWAWRRVARRSAGDEASRPG